MPGVTSPSDEKLGVLGDHLPTAGDPASPEGSQARRGDLSSAESPESGVNLIVAASFLATIGEISRFESPRKLVGYLGLDPRVRQSGSGPATHGRISKQGSIRARHALAEASWSTVRQPGPIRAFYERVRARRGHQVAVVAAARKLACLCWCLLSRRRTTPTRSRR
jgi:hypothetical protein